MDMKINLLYCNAANACQEKIWGARWEEGMLEGCLEYSRKISDTKFFDLKK
jgi:hypothetical protein